MPRKTKAELAAEKEALENTDLEAMEQEQEEISLPSEVDGLEAADSTNLPEDKP